MEASKAHVVVAAGVGALLPFIPDLVKLIPGLPSAASNALCAVVVAVAYALSPAKKPGSEAGFARPNAVVFVAAIAALFVACGLFATAKEPADPAKETRAAIKSAELACLGCTFPNLPKEAQAACEKLDPVCKALAGMCDEPDAGK